MLHIDVIIINIIIITMFSKYLTKIKKQSRKEEEEILMG